MNNTIKVTACDNELILIAYQWEQSFELVKIQSGNFNTVDLTVNIETGPFQGGIVVNGVNNPIRPSNYNVYLPSGEYTLIAIGIDWGGPEGFTFTFNDERYTLAENRNPEPDSGVVWTPAPIKFIV